MSFPASGQEPLPTPPSDGSTRSREHLANERTLLAWVRTSIAFMGLGFVVARFGLFLRQLALQHPGLKEPDAVISGGIGVAMVAGGVLAATLGAVRFFRTRTQIDSGTFKPEVFTEVAVVIVTVLGGLALVVYLALSQ